MEASRAIDPGSSTEAPKAMLSLLTLVHGHAFNLDDFVAGAMPPKDQIAAGQTLVNLSC